MFCYCGFTQIDNGDVVKGNLTCSRHANGQLKQNRHAVCSKGTASCKYGDSIMKSGTKRSTNVKWWGRFFSRKLDSTCKLVKIWRWIWRLHSMRCYESSAVVIVISIMGELPLTYLNVSSVIARKHGCVLYSYLQKGSEQLRPAHTQSIYQITKI